MGWETGDETGLSAFHTWQDAVAFTWGQRTYYWLEAVEADGSSTFTGPVEVLGIGRLFLPSVAR